MTTLVPTFLIWLVIGLVSFTAIHLLALRFGRPQTSSPALFIAGGALVSAALGVWPGGGCAIIPIVFFAAMVVADTAFSR